MRAARKRSLSLERSRRVDTVILRWRVAMNALTDILSIHQPSPTECEWGMGSSSRVATLAEATDLDKDNGTKDPPVPHQTTKRSVDLAYFARYRWRWCMGIFYNR